MTVLVKYLRRPVTFLACSLILSCCCISYAQDLVKDDLDPALARELKYAEALQRMGLPDYAEIVLNKISDPRALGRLELIKIQGKLAMGKFDDVIAIISRKPDQNSQAVWEMKLSLADAYYAWGKYPQAQGVYEGFFKAYSGGPKAGMKSFYLNSAYKYAQMLLLMGNEKRALSAYEYALKALPKNEEETSHVRRQVLGEMAELLVKLAETAKDKKQQSYFQKVDTILNEILWKQDLWFGKAIVMMAHIQMMRGETDRAMKLIDDYKENLLALDRDLQPQFNDGEDLTHLSPMAEVRYLLGTMMQQEAEKLIKDGTDKKQALKLIAGYKEGKRKVPGALQHYVNVFYNYPKTKWAPEAGERMEHLLTVLDEVFGKKVNIPVTKAHREKVKTIQFQNARMMYNQQQFKQAAEAYVKLLGFYPEGEQALSVLDDVAICYIEEQEELYADTTLMYMAERFANDDALLAKAGDQVLRVAEHYRDLKMFEKKDWAYSLYFAYYKKHPRAAAILYRFGEERYQEGDWDGALSYFLELNTDYQSSPMYPGAVSRIAGIYSQQEKTSEEIKVLKQYVEILEAQDRPGPALINAQYRMAIAYRKLGPKYLKSALNRYSELIKLLADKKKMDSFTEEEQKINHTILGGAMYQKAACYSLLKSKDAKMLRKYQLISIKLFEEFVSQFPKTEQAPSALMQIGTLWTILGKADRAEVALKKLQKDYPSSPPARNADFMRAMSLLKLGRRQAATKLFKKMITSTGKFSDLQILTAASELLKVEEHQLALEAYDRVLKMGNKDRRIREPAMLGKGKCLIHLAKFRKGADTLDEMLKEYPQSPYTIEACLFLNKTYGELGRKESDKNDRKLKFNRAINALKRAKKFLSSGEARLKKANDFKGAAVKGAAVRETDLRIARIFVLKAEAEKEFGSEAAAAQYLNDAIATYQTLIILSDLSRKEIRPHVETAYAECIPLMFEVGKFKNVVEDCDSFFDIFPASREYGSLVRKWRNKAERELAASGAPAAVPEAPAEEPAAAVAE